MTMFVIQSLLLLAIAFVLGCIIGALARHYVVANAKREIAENLDVSEVSSSRDIHEVPEDETNPEPKPVQPERVVEPEPEPETTLLEESESLSVSGQTNEKDDLKRIKGIGIQNEARLNAIGVSTFLQIAGWSDLEQQEIGERLAFPGRIEREKWVEQAKRLAGSEDSKELSQAEKSEVHSASEPKESVGTEPQPRPALLSEPPAEGADNLIRIEGVGNALERKLNNLGVYTFKQISQWSAEHQKWVGDEIGFPGRPERENWVEEAKALIATEPVDEPRDPERGEITTTRKARL